MRSLGTGVVVMGKSALALLVQRSERILDPLESVTALIPEGRAAPEETQLSSPQEEEEWWLTY